MRVDVTASSAAIRRAIGQIRWYDANSRLGAERAIHSAVRRMAYRAKASVPRGRGVLRDSIYYSMKKALLRGEFGAKKPHAHLVEYGTTAHKTVLKNRKALRFNVGGKELFRHSTQVPSIRGRPFMKPAYEAEEPKFLADIEKVLRKT